MTGQMPPLPIPAWPEYGHDAPFSDAYNADQMHAYARAYAAERVAPLVEALRELAALKDIKERQQACWPNDPEAPELAREYSRRKNAAWSAARATLDAEQEKV